MASKHTIEVHLNQDQRFYKSLPPDADFAISVRSRIIETAQLLAQLHGGPIVLDSALDAGGFLPDSPKGALFKNHDFHLLILLLLLLFYPKASYNHTDNSDQEANVPSEVFRQPEHNQGDVVEPDKCVTLV